ncbi:MAG: hypothetical protein Q9201_006214 [Fulgogasparrea decipioides]
MDRVIRNAPGYRSLCAQCRWRLSPSWAFLRPISISIPKSVDSSDPRPLPQTPIDVPDATADAAASMQQPTDQTASPSLNSTSSTASDPTIQNGGPSFVATIQQARNSNAFTRTSGSSSQIYDLFGSDTKSDQNQLAGRSIADYPPLPEPHHLHIYSTKHNTHITLTKPDRNPIISVSAGTIGFRKAARGTYDAAYQLGAYVMGRIQQQGLLTQIQRLEVVLRDFGEGRQAVTKILLGSEGRNLRGRVVRVCDATRLKFGGTRSKKPRRLG